MDKTKDAPKPLQQPAEAKAKLPQPPSEQRDAPKYVRGVASPEKRG